MPQAHKIKYRYLKVNPPLREYIRTALVTEYDSGLKSSELPLFTNGMPALLCKIENNEHHIVLFGQSVPDEYWSIGNNPIIIAWFFKPFVPATLFKLSAKELKKQPFDLVLWNAQKAMALRVQLHHAQSINEKIKALDNFISAQLQNNRRECEVIRFATDMLMQNATKSDALSQLLRELNLTERTFQRIFKKYVGITANEYRKICRFYFAFSQLKGGHYGKLTDVAYANGYFDQSHFIRSFKEFTETTPVEYLQSGLRHKSE